MSVDNDARPDVQSLDRDAALVLDQCIRRTADLAGEHLDELAALLIEAKAGQIHESLGFPSWTAYAVDRLKPITSVLSRSCGLG